MLCFFSSKDTFVKKRNALFWYNVFGIVGDGGGRAYQRYDISSYSSTDPCFGNGSHMIMTMMMMKNDE